MYRHSDERQSPLPPKLLFIKQCAGPYCTQSIQTKEKFCSFDCQDWFENRISRNQQLRIESDPDRRYRRIGV